MTKAFLVSRGFFSRSIDHLAHGKLPHIHFARFTERHGQWAYDICRCSARRTRRVPTPKMYAALRPGFPSPQLGWVYLQEVSKLFLQQYRAANNGRTRAVLVADPNSFKTKTKPPVGRGGGSPIKRRAPDSYLFRD